MEKEIEFHKNGQVYCERFRLNGKLHGNQRSWYMSGNRLSNFNTVDGLDQGMSQFFNDDATRMYVSMHKIGNRNGSYISFKYAN